MYLNKATIIGNLTRDPELKALPSGVQVCSFSVATNRTWKDKNGAKQEAADFHNVISFGKQAEVIAQYMKKGSQVYVEGRLQTRSWEQGGEKKYRTEIIVENFQFGSRPQNQEKPQQASVRKPVEEQSSPEEESISYPEEEINPEDIPF